MCQTIMYNVSVMIIGFCEQTRFLLLPCKILQFTPVFDFRREIKGIRNATVFLREFDVIVAAV